MKKKSEEAIRGEVFIVLIAILLFGGAIVGLYGFHGNWFDRRDAGLPTDGIIQSEVPVESVPVVQATTNETEAALARLGFSLSNSVKVSVK